MAGIPGITGGAGDMALDFSAKSGADAVQGASATGSKVFNNGAGSSINTQLMLLIGAGLVALWLILKK